MRTVEAGGTLKSRRMKYTRRRDLNAEYHAHGRRRRAKRNWRCFRCHGPCVTTRIHFHNLQRRKLSQDSPARSRRGHARWRLAETATMLIFARQAIAGEF
jgi:hypothetical protein